MLQEDQDDVSLEEELADIKLRQKMEQIKKLNISMDPLDDDLDAGSSKQDDDGYEEQKSYEEFYLDDGDDTLDDASHNPTVKEGQDCVCSDGERMIRRSEESKLDPV